MFGTFLFSVSTNSLTDARVPLHFQFPPTMNRPVPSETTRTVDGALLLPALPLVPRLFVARTKALDPIDIVRLLALIIIAVVVVDGDDVRVVGGAATNMSCFLPFSLCFSLFRRACFFCRVVSRSIFFWIYPNDNESTLLLLDTTIPLKETMGTRGAFSMFLLLTQE